MLKSCLFLLPFLTFSVVGQTAAQPEILWEYPLGTSGVDPSPALAPDGTIYVATADLMDSGANSLIALNLDGTRKWSIRSFFFGHPAVAVDGTIYAKNFDRTLHAYRPDASLKGTFPAGGLTAVLSAAIGNDGTVYSASSENQFGAFEPDGTLIWQFNVEPQLTVTTSGAVARDGTVYFGAAYPFFTTNGVYALDPAGGLKWKFPFTAMIQSSPAIGDDGTVYFGDGHGRFYALAGDGSKKWEVQLDAGIGGGPAIGIDGTLYVGAANGLHAIHPDGTRKWTFPTDAVVRSTPAIAFDGTVYFTAYHKVYALNADGSVRWQWEVPSNSSPAIGADGTVYVSVGGPRQGKLVALRGSSGPAQSPWPMFKQNAQRTGLAGGSVAFKFRSQPQSQTVAEGNAVNLEVQVESETPVEFQWRHNGTNIAGATNATYSIRFVRAADAGAYDVQVKNERGHAVSGRSQLAVLASVPFVERTLPEGFYLGSKIIVVLSARPMEAATVYAVEDQPPPGWVVGALSDGGTYDRATHKLKFGPYFDHTPRALTYEITPPAVVFANDSSFTGVGSVHGISSPIAGASTVRVSGLLHPADSTPADNRLSIDETTAYSAAWRVGEAWPIPPNPIPIDFITRVAALWKGGERYAYDPGLPEAPLWWVNPPPSPAAARAAYSPQAASTATTGVPSAICELASPYYVPTQPLPVRVAIAPASGVFAYAVEEEIPGNWQVDGISHDGMLDAVNRRVKWGPFFDHQPRDFSYRLLPNSTATGAVALIGRASFDGVNVPIRGQREVVPSSRLDFSATAAGSRVQLQFTGVVGNRYVIEVSDDLLFWRPFTTVTNTSGSLVVPDEAGAHAQRFYRARTP